MPCKVRKCLGSSWQVSAALGCRVSLGADLRRKSTKRFTWQGFSYVAPALFACSTLMGTFESSKLKAERATPHGRLGCQRHCGGLGWKYVQAVRCGPTFEPRLWVVSQVPY